MKIMMSTSLLSAALLMSACGGSSSGGSSFEETGAISVGELNDTFEELFDFSNTAVENDIMALSSDALEAQGSANYTGLLIGASDDFDDALIGRARINADFTDGGSLSGDVTDLALISEGTTEIDGDIDPSELFPSDTEFTQLDGSLTLSGGSISSSDGLGEINVDVDGDVSVPTSLLVDGGTGIQEFEVTGNLTGLVADTGQFLAVGELAAESDTFGFDVDTVIFAD